MTSILDLPAELIANIFRHLDNSAIFDTRQANKHLERASFSFFAKHFFRKKGYMITTSSLNVLELISKHQGLRTQVQHIWFNPDCYTFTDGSFYPDDGVSEIYAEQQLSVGACSKAWRACREDHQALLCSDLLTQKLERVLRDLPNLQVIGMRRGEDHNPWGWSKLRSTVGADPRVLGPIPYEPIDALSGSTYLFIALMRSIAATGLQLKRLYTDSIEIDYIRPDLLPTETLAKACRSILYIELNATRAWLSPKYDREYATHIEPTQYGDGLVKLLGATTQLRELGLMIFPDRQQSHLVPPQGRQGFRPLSWQAGYPYIVLEKLSESVQLGQLQHVKLEKLATSANILTNMLRPCHERLQSLKLRDIRLVSENKEDQRPWQTFFKFLRDDCLKLRYLLLYHLAYDHGGVRFVEALPPRPPADPAVPRLETVANAGDFTDFENITAEATGREAVASKLEQITDRHWYGKNIFSYDLDEVLWHTDTSDEEW